MPAREYADLALRIDGKAFASAAVSQPIPLDPGRHKVEVSATGRDAQTIEVQLAEGDVKIQNVELAAVIETQAGTVHLSPNPPHRATWPRTLVVVGEGLLAATGIALVIASRVSAANADATIAGDHTILRDDDGACFAPSMKLAGTCADLHQAAADRHAADSQATVGAIMAVAGGVALVGTWLLWSTDGRETHIIERASISPTPNGVLLSGAFR